MICGIIDLGSNTIRLSIYRFEKEILTPLLSKKSIAGLLGYIESGELSSKGINKACSVLNNFKDIINNFGIESSYVFATASLRNITNRDEVLRIIKENTDFEIDLISGEEEALLDYCGASRIVDMESGLLVDIGGGSTELVSFKDSVVNTAVSIPVGSLNLSLKHVKTVLPKKSDIQKMKDEIKEEFRKIDLPVFRHNTVCGVGGTLRAAKKLYNDKFGLPSDNVVMDADKFSTLLFDYKNERKDIVRRVIQLAPDRIHTVITGIVILNTIVDKCRCNKIIVSSYGVREGYLYRKVLDGESTCS
jgi:exopolyphosphatase/guanosine-5'-triphosphate,3'-diphosphate pyrophosphatase